MKNDFDPISYERELERTGVPHEQAHVHAHALDTVASNCVTIHELEKVLREEIKAVSSNSDGHFALQKSEHTVLRERVDDLGMRLEKLSERVEELNLRLEMLSERVDRLSERMDRLSERVEELSERVAALENRMARIETKLKMYDRLFGLMFAMQAAIMIKQYFP